MSNYIQADTRILCAESVWPEDPEINSKLTYIRNQVVDGHCYLWLIFSISEASKLDFSRFKHVVCEFRFPEPNPEGSKVIEGLVDTAAFICHELGSTLESMRPLGWGGFRFNLSDIGARLHLECSSVFGCQCDSNICDHGWSFIGIACLMVRPGMLIGASTIDFSGLFQDAEEQFQHTTEPTLQVSPDRVTSQVERDSSHHQTWRPLFAGEPGSGPSDGRRATVESEEQDLRRQIEELRLRVEAKEDLQRLASSFGDENEALRLLMKKTTQGARFTCDLGPNDSSSVIGRYKNRYMEQGTVLGSVMESTEQNGGGEVALREPPQRDKFGAVVVGYQRTELMKRTERESDLRIHAVNGLCRPFKNDELNFLCHMYTAMNKYRALGPELFLSSLWTTISPSFHASSASEELLSMVLTSTFDLSTKRIKSNFFSLPYLEVGMDISERAVITCFDLLESKYKSLWFQEMKELDVPGFHSSYSSLSSENSSGRTGSASGSVGSDKSHRRPSSRHGKRRASSSSATSLFGF